jgi:hypothetical protein
MMRCLRWMLLGIPGLLLTAQAARAQVTYQVESLGRRQCPPDFQQQSGNRDRGLLGGK